LFTVESLGAEETLSLAERFAAYLLPGSVVTLSGELGAGKTVFAKGVAKGLGVGEHVTSPTFTIIHEYMGRLPFYHMDAYRLEDESEAGEIGIEEYFDSDGITLVEWPERIESIIPPEAIRVTLTKAWREEGDEYRVISFAAQGDEEGKLLREFACHENTRS
jgi:tRNA threonylcarbamoyladenosine biosynthesis protein TsaE